ncbi:hypothetical protein LCGC14_2219800 [marine sediment metagenome]|uniref:Uncharacterized protein n=1 Tax=marine sediment metagenome TaxID=412755 RepID=A0A0F9FNW7_9ZZZZ
MGGLAISSKLKEKSQLFIDQLLENKVKDFEQFLKRVCGWDSQSLWCYN